MIVNPGVPLIRPREGHRELLGEGGVGKTSAAVNLAWLAARSGRRTLLWDLDSQAAATYLLRTEAKVKGGSERSTSRRPGQRVRRQGAHPRVLSMVGRRRAVRRDGIELMHGSYGDIAQTGAPLALAGRASVAT